MVELQLRPVRTGPGAGTGWLVAFVAVELAALLLVVTDAVPHLLPGPLATQVGHNSEVFALAALLSPAVWWLRGQRAGGSAPARPHRVAAVVGAGAVALVALALVLLQLDEQPRLKTLNEPVLAAGVLLVYCAVWPRRRTLALASPAMLVLVTVFFHTDFVLLQAESLVALVLAPVGLDLAARWLLQPAVRQSLVPAYLWGGFLLVAPLVLMLLRASDLGPSLGAAVDYAARGYEAFWGLFLVHLLGIVAWAPQRTERSPSEEVAPG